jgi:prepilin-type N-terminal cleavage/methylation domain-containing protein
MREKAMRSARGFTLLEVIIAAAISLFLVAGAFVAVGRAHQTSIGQERAVDLASQARLVMELIGRDIRNAGDSVQFLPSHCLVNPATGVATQAPGAPFGCPAILEPHPWRLTMTRYMWDAGADGIPFTADDQMSTAVFSANPENVVSYQFVPRQQWSNGEHRGYLGRIERVVNPFGFAGQDPVKTILLDNVLVDNRMLVSPDGSQRDERRDYSVFMYRILSVTSGEYSGHQAYTQRATKEGSFILPPMRFFAFPNMGDIPAWEVNQEGLEPPYLPAGYTTELVGLQPDASTVGTLRASSAGFAADLRYVLDFNRIRAVNVSFKVVESREDPGFFTGIDLDPDTPGTARVLQVESTYELKVFSGYLH